MKEARRHCGSFSVILMLLCSWLIEDVNSHPTSFHKSRTKPSSSSSKLMYTRRTASGTPIGYRLDAWSQYDNPEEGTEREGDIHVPPQSRKTTTTNINLLWPNGLVNYYVHSSIVNEPMKLAMLEHAIDIIMARTCVKFARIQEIEQIPANTWLNITGHRPGCFSDLGRNPYRPTVLNLDVTVCFRTIGHSLHEMLHALGVYHEHMRPDRDDYITIMWANIKEGDSHNFRLLNKKVVTSYGLPYDYDSVMHYSMTAFSKNRSIPTIIPTIPDAEIGQRNHLSHYDVQKLLITYKCSIIDTENSDSTKEPNLAGHEKFGDHLREKLPQLNETALEADAKSQAATFTAHNSISNRFGDNMRNDLGAPMDEINEMIFARPVYPIQSNYPMSLNYYPIYPHIHFHFYFHNE